MRQTVYNFEVPESEPYEIDVPDVDYDNLTPEQKKIMEEHPELFLDPTKPDDGIDYEELLDELEEDIKNGFPNGILIESPEHLIQVVMDVGRRMAEEEDRCRAASR